MIPPVTLSMMTASYSVLPWAFEPLSGVKSTTRLGSLYSLGVRTEVGGFVAGAAGAASRLACAAVSRRSLECEAQPWYHVVCSNRRTLPNLVHAAIFRQARTCRNSSGKQDWVGSSISLRISHTGWPCYTDPRTCKSHSRMCSTESITAGWMLCRLH